MPQPINGGTREPNPTMIQTHRLLLAACAALIAAESQAATGPQVFGPDNVYDSYELKLDPGTVTSGNWTIDWGDSTPASTIPVSQTVASHPYPNAGSYEIKAVLRDATGKLIDSQYSYRELVRKTGPLLHYNFEDAGGSQHIGPAITKVGVVNAVNSFAGSTGNATRLSAGSYLSIPDLEMKDSCFFGLEFWLKPTTLTTRQVVYSGVGNGSGNVTVYLEGGNLCFELTGSGVIKSVPLGYGVEAGRWYHFAVNYERSAYFEERNSLRFYRDGFLLKKDSYTADQALLVNHKGATIGVRNGGTIASPAPSYPLSADIDEVVLHRLGVFPGAFLERYRAATTNRSVFRISSGADGAAPFIVDQPVITSEITVGLDPNPAVDNAVRIRVAIRDAAPGTRIKLVDQTTGLGGGTYYLRKAYAARLFPFENKTDIELDGNGMNFIVSDWWSAYVQIKSSTRIAVKNMSFDIDQNEWRVGAYAQVHGMDPANKKLRIRWVKGKNLEPDVMTPKIAQAEKGLWRYRRVDAVNRRNISDEQWSIVDKEPDPIDGSFWTLTLHPETSSWIWDKFADIQAAGDLLQVNNCVFGPSGASVSDSSHVTFDGFKLYAATGMGFLSGSFSNLKVVNSKIGLPPGMTADDRPFATGSDGFHFHSARNGRVLFENNDVAMTDDDPISIKDNIVGSVQKMGETQLKLGLGRRMGTNSFELRTRELERLVPPYTAIITGYDAATDISTIDRPLPGNVGDKFTLQKLEEYTGN
ncbi:MAG TPA: hypothetical protein PLZ55_10160, partial [bacterium]|nr:hypothetical protein [bacterium]